MNTIKVEVVVPDWVEWIAVDKSGECWGFENKPKPIKSDCVWYYSYTTEARFQQLYVGKPPKNWKLELYSYG